MLLLLAAAIQVGAWAFATAPLSGPDEADHFVYAQHLAETGGPPTQTDLASPSTEARSAELWLGLHALNGNPTARPAWTAADLTAWRRIDDAIGTSGRSDGAAVGRNPPLYYAYEAVPYVIFERSGLLTRALAMRLWSALLYLATIVLVWLLAGELVGRGRWQVFATAAVVCMPELAFIGGLINPDNLLVTVTTGFLYAAVLTVKRGPSPARALAIGALTAAAVLTHGRGFALVPPAIAVVVLSLLVHRPDRRTAATVAAAALAVAAVGPLIAVLATKGSGGAYGGEVGNATGAGFDARQFVSYVWQFYLPRLGFMQPMIGVPYGFRQAWVDRLFGTFGSLEVTYPSWDYSWLYAAALAGLLAFAGACAVQWRRLRAQPAVVLLLLIVIVSVLGVLHYIAYRHLQLTPNDPLLTGRYLLPLIGLFGVAVAFVGRALPRAAQPVYAGLFIAAGIALQLSGLALSAVRFYG